MIDFESLLGKTRIFRKNFGNPFKAQVAYTSDNNQYVQLILENGSKVWELTDCLTLEEDIEKEKTK